MTSWWENQKSYADFAVVDLATHDALPTDPPCPQSENPNYEHLFGAGDTVIVGAYFRDATPSRTTALSLRRPDGTRRELELRAPETKNSSKVFWEVDLPDILLATTRGRWELPLAAPVRRLHDRPPPRVLGRGAVRRRLRARELVEAGWQLPIALP